MQLYYSDAANFKGGFTGKHLKAHFKANENKFEDYD